MRSIRPTECGGLRTAAERTVTFIMKDPMGASALGAALARIDSGIRAVALYITLPPRLIIGPSLGGRRC